MYIDINGDMFACIHLCIHIFQYLHLNNQMLLSTCCVSAFDSVCKLMEGLKILYFG